MTYKYKKKIINSPGHSLPSIRGGVSREAARGRGFGEGALVAPFYYILSGTSMPSSAMPFLMVFATFWASTKRTAFSSALSAPRIE